MNRPFDHLANKLNLAVFRVNGALIAAGDAVTAPVGLTSARWQVLGAIAQSENAETVSGLARQMGLVRQAVQRLVNEMDAEGFVELIDNPAHRRAKLVQMTAKGRSAFDKANARWLPIADNVLADNGENALAATVEMLLSLEAQLKATVGDDAPERRATEPFTELEEKHP